MSMAVMHHDLAEGRWHELSLAEQLGNIGSEVSRAAGWQGKNDHFFQGAIDRALELIDLTIADARWRGRLKEIVRAREVLCDAISGAHEYEISLEYMDQYFLSFALATQNKKGYNIGQELNAG